MLVRGESCECQGWPLWRRCCAALAGAGVTDGVCDTLEVEVISSTGASGQDTAFSALCNCLSLSFPRLHTHTQTTTSRCCAPSSISKR